MLKVDFEFEIAFYTFFQIIRFTRLGRIKSQSEFEKTIVNLSRNENIRVNPNWIQSAAKNN